MAASKAQKPPPPELLQDYISSIFNSWDKILKDQIANDHEVAETIFAYLLETDKTCVALGFRENDVKLVIGTNVVARNTEVEFEGGQTVREDVNLIDNGATLVLTQTTTRVSGQLQPCIETATYTYEGIVDLQRAWNGRVKSYLVYKLKPDVLPPAPRPDIRTGVTFSPNFYLDPLVALHVALGELTGRNSVAPPESTYTQHLQLTLQELINHLAITAQHPEREYIQEVTLIYLFNHSFLPKKEKFLRERVKLNETRYNDLKVRSLLGTSIEKRSRTFFEELKEEQSNDTSRNNVDQCIEELRFFWAACRYLLNYVWRQAKVTLSADSESRLFRWIKDNTEVHGTSHATIVRTENILQITPPADVPDNRSIHAELLVADQCESQFIAVSRLCCSKCAFALYGRRIENKILGYHHKSAWSAYGFKTYHERFHSGAPTLSQTEDVLAAGILAHVKSLNPQKEQTWEGLRDVLPKCEGSCKRSEQTGNVLCFCQLDLDCAARCSFLDFIPCRSTDGKSLVCSFNKDSVDLRVLNSSLPNARVFEGDNLHIFAAWSHLYDLFVHLIIDAKLPSQPDIHLSVAWMQISEWLTRYSVLNQIPEFGEFLKNIRTIHTRVSDEISSSTVREAIISSANLRCVHAECNKFKQIFLTKYLLPYDREPILFSFLNLRRGSGGAVTDADL